MEPLCRLLQTWSGVWNGAGRSLAVALRSAGLFFVSLFCSLLSSPPLLHLCCFAAIAMALFHTVTILNWQSCSAAFGLSSPDTI